MTVPTTGPGTELRNLLKQLGIHADENCGCNAKMEEMNRWGVDGCRVKKTEIVAWLVEQRAKRGWGEVLAAGVKAVTLGLVLNPLAIESGLVDEAIRRASCCKENDCKRQ